jgi:NAD+ synthase (glutamine-hydrolysing)
MSTTGQFFNLYHHDFVRAAVVVPDVRVADPAFHAEQTIEFLDRACQNGAMVALFPELGLSSYTCDDLFHQAALLDGCLDALQTILQASSAWPIVGIVGTPLRIENVLFNCAVVFCKGQILGIIPKSYLPNYREFYEARQFQPATSALLESVDLLGQRSIPFGNKLVFEWQEQPLFRFHVEICEDLWVPVPPSCYAALAGATVLFNLSASNITIGKAAYRKQLVANQSARCLAAYLYTAAGTGESTTDLAWDGHGLIIENGAVVAESKRFQYEPQLVFGDLDLERLSQERMRQNSFGESVRNHLEQLKAFRRISFSLPVPQQAKLALERIYERFPYVPANHQERDERCYEAYEIQVQGLVKRLKSAKIQKVVIGVSGGLDSTHALIVCARAMDSLGISRNNILGYTMPGFATSERTKQQAHDLMRSIGCTVSEIDIRPSCEQMLKDIGHPFGKGEQVYDVTFENVQAGERTSHLFRLANHLGALVVGTGDLSELALGWCTYGVGDQMSHYNVNGSVPKTLIQFLIRWAANTNQLGEEVSQVLMRILDTEISPELVPGKDEEGQPTQKTEAVIGPYEVQDFYLYYTLRYGFRPTRTAFLAYSAWHDVLHGVWPDTPQEKRNAYSMAELKKFLKIFLFRFFQISQFKRSCLPNGPKVGSGGSLSPRGDYRAPSDSESRVWLSQLESIPDTDELP